MNNTISEIASATATSGLGNLDMGELVATVKSFTMQLVAARVSDQLFGQASSQAPGDVNRGVDVVPPSTPPSTIAAAPAEEQPPTTPVFESLPTPAVQMETPRTTHEPEPETELNPGPTARAGTSMVSYTNPTMAPDLQERPSANYASPGGRREAVWDVEERQQDAQVEARTNGSPSKRRRREESPQACQGAQDSRGPRPYHGDWWSLENILEQIKSGKVMELEMTATTMEGHLGMLGSHHNLDLSVQAINAREKEVQKAMSEIIRCQMTLANAPKYELLALYARTARTVVNAKK